MNNIKRKIINLGIFSLPIIHGKKIDNELLFSIYSKLKENGFKETPWQVIYDEQIAGLVLPHKEGKNEIHLRFFKDRLFAEFEIGRAYLSHFIAERYNANSYVYDNIKDIFTENELKLFSSFIDPSNYRFQEKNMKRWDGRSDLFENSRLQERTFLSLLALFYIFDTKAIITALLCLAIILSISITDITWASILPSILPAGIVIALMRLLPSRGKP